VVGCFHAVFLQDGKTKNMNSIDIFIQNYFSVSRTPFITELMYILTSFFSVDDLMSGTRFVVIVLCIAVLIYLVRNLRYSILFVVTLFSGAVITYLLKIFFNVSRPLDAVIIEITKSFPSYHATVATIFFVMLMYIFDDHLKSLARIIFNTFCVVCILLIALSRMYLGVHWLSDVVGGIVLGSLISYIFAMVFSHFFRKP